MNLIARTKRLDCKFSWKQTLAYTHMRARSNEVFLFLSIQVHVRIECYSHMFAKKIFVIKKKYLDIPIWLAVCCVLINFDDFVFHWIRWTIFFPFAMRFCVSFVLFEFLFYFCTYIVFIHSLTSVWYFFRYPDLYIFLENDQLHLRAISNTSTALNELWYTIL